MKKMKVELEYYEMKIEQYGWKWMSWTQKFDNIFLKSEWRNSLHTKDLIPFTSRLDNEGEQTVQTQGYESLK